MAERMRNGVVRARQVMRGGTPVADTQGSMHKGLHFSMRAIANLHAGVNLFG